MKREDVYKLIDSEREYQNAKPPRPLSDRDTPLASWLLYMEHMLNEAKASVYFLQDDISLEYVRKVAALAVACMENNETRLRE